MNKKLLLAIPLVIAATLLNSFYMQKENTLTSAEKKAGWKLLFDGKTINGWRMYQNKATDCWGAKNGELYCKGSEKDKSDLRADIITKEQYENFELMVDWKIAPQGNSGIMYHVTEDYPVAYKSGPEYQLIDDIGFPGKLEEWQKTGADYGMNIPNYKKKLKPVGEWNTSSILFNKGHVEHWLNGEKIVEFQAWSPEWMKQKAEGKWKDYPDYGLAKKGHIALQDHGNKVYFKNIQITEL